MSVLSQFATIQGGALETTGSSNITLTVSSAKLQAVNMTATALSVTLPAATTLKKGGPLYIIKNTGSYIFTVLDGSAGVLITMYPEQSATFSLANNGTTAGVWVVGAYKAESIINPYIPTIVHAGTGTYYKVCQMSATQALLVMSTNSIRTLNLSGTAFNLGTELTAGVSVGNLYTCLISLTSTTALYVWSTYVVDKYVLHAAVITVSGTTCSIGTTVVCAEGSGFAGTGLARLTNTTAVACQGPDAYVITVSGTVPSFGAKQASLTATQTQLSPISSTSVLATYGTNRKVLSVSGNTVTAPSGAITRNGTSHYSGVMSTSTALTVIGETTGYNTVVEQVAISGTALTSSGVYPVTDHVVPNGGSWYGSAAAALSSTQALLFVNHTGTYTAGSSCVLITLVAGFFRVSTPMAVLPEVGNNGYMQIIPMSATRAMVFCPSAAGLYGNIVDII